MVKAVIFDLDGTLADTLDSIAYYANGALAHFGYKTIETQQYKQLVGDGASVLVERMLSYIGADLKESEYIAPFYNKTYDDNPLYLTKPYNGIIELLDELRKRNIKTAVLSNKPHSTTQKVAGSLFGDRINLCWGKSDKYPRKPDPTALLAMLDVLDVKKNEALYVGDTSTDMLTGHNADVFTIGVLWGFRNKQELEEYNAGMLVSHPLEILSKI